jgi:hypothetical protein
LYVFIIVWVWGIWPWKLFQVVSKGLGKNYWQGNGHI